jgi:hypothetical protein
MGRRLHATKSLTTRGTALEVYREMGTALLQAVYQDLFVCFVYFVAKHPVLTEPLIADGIICRLLSRQ